jgi:hypothetical protein
LTRSRPDMGQLQRVMGELMTGWRRGWDSNPQRVLITRKLLILHDGESVQTVKVELSVQNCTKT